MISYNNYLRPTYLSVIFTFIHVAANGIISFFLWLSNIPLYIYLTVFIQSSVDGYLGRFHILAIVNSVAVNIGVHVPGNKDYEKRPLKEFPLWCSGKEPN